MGRIFRIPNLVVKIISITLLMFVPLVSYAITEQESSVKEGSVLSLDDCVGIAINNSPRIKGKAYNLQIAISNLGIAKSAYFPSLGVGAGVYQEYNSTKEYRGSSNRDIPSVNVYLSQLLWNFGKTTSLIRMERFYKLGAEYEFLDSICHTIFDVKAKYFLLLRAKSMLEIAENNVKINENNVKRAKKLASQNEKYKIDYTNANINLSEAKIQLQDAITNYDLALADLGNVMFIAPAPDFSIKALDTYEFKDVYMPVGFDGKSKAKVDTSLKEVKNTPHKFKEMPCPLKDAYDIAERNNPDLWVLDATISAMKQALTFVKRQYLPDVTGNVGYGFNNSRYYSNSSLQMYVNLTSNVNVKQLKHEIDRAQAQVDLATNDVVKFRQDLYFRVRKAYLSVVLAEKQVKNSEIKLLEAKQNFELVNLAYDNLETDYIAYQRARKDYNDAKIQYADMLYEYNHSVAHLEIAMHSHVDNLHDRAHHAMEYHYKGLLKQLESSLNCDHHNEGSEGGEEHEHHHHRHQFLNI